MIYLFKDRFLLIVILVSIPMLALAFAKPLSFDNAMYQNMALDLYRFGKVPYIGSWDQNFPGIIYIHYLAIIIFGTSDLSIRLLDTIVQLLFVAFLYRFWSLWLRPGTAALTAVLYIAYYVSAGGLLLSQRDVYAGIALFVSLWVILRVREHPKSSFAWSAVAGLVCGITILLRLTGLLYAAILCMSLLLPSTNRMKLSLRPLENLRWMDALAFLTASLVPLGVVLAYYAVIPGSLEAIYLTTIRWNLDLYTRIDNGMPGLASQFMRRALLVPIVIYAFVNRRKLAKYLINSVSQWEKLLYVSLIGASLVVALVMRKYFDYHFVPFFMLIMPLAALGIELAASRFTPPLAHHYAIVLGVYLATFLAYPLKDPLAFGLALTMERNPMDFTYAVQYPNPYWGAEPEWATMRYLNLPANRDGSVDVCSLNPNLQLHLGRDHAGKYFQMLGLAYRLNPAEEGLPRYTDYQLRWQREFVDSLRVKRPRFIVLARNTHLLYFEDVYNDLLRYIPGFDSLLGASYRYDTAFGGYQIFRLRSDSINAKLLSVAGNPARP